jgi:hypothetical protein
LGTADEQNAKSEGIDPVSAYPTLILPQGITWKYKKSPKFNVIRQDAHSARHPAVATLQYGVIYEFELNWSYLKVKGVTTQNDIRYMQEFYEAMRGSYGLFTFDPGSRNLDDMLVFGDTTQLSNGGSGKTDGVNTTFQLWRSTNIMGGGIYTLCERIQNVTGLYGVTLAGAVQPTNTYVLENFPAQIQFNHVPPAGQDLSWWGTYSYLCQFADDTQDFDEFLYQLWNLDSLKLESIQL